MDKLIINSEKTLLIAQGVVARDFRKYKYISLSLDHQKRSVISNSLQFWWYKELETQGDMTANEYRRYCKYHFGLGLRAAKDEYFANWIRKIFGLYVYEDRLEQMDYIDVTSTFDRPTMSLYLTEIKNHYTPEGFVLTSSEDL